MAFTRLIAVYVGMVGLISSITGGFVACGAQTYRIPVNNDVGVVSKNGMSAAINNIEGIHSPQGWAGRLPIGYRFAPDVDPQKRLQIQKAMLTWEKGAEVSLFNYEGLDDRIGRDFVGLYKPLDDMINGHYFDETWVISTNKPAEVLATTIWENDASNKGVIIKADIRYNSENYILGNSLENYSEGEKVIVDLESLALHEIGHLLGLAHMSEDDDPFSVMLPTLFIGEGTYARVLSDGDTERIRRIYNPALLGED